VGTRTSLAGKLAVVALLAAVVALPGCRGPEDPWKHVPGGAPRVLTSFAPIYCFAKAVAGPDVAVLSLLTTSGPHDHSEGADDMLAAQKADLFLINGLTIDDFATKVANSSGNSKSADQLIRSLSDGIPADRLYRFSGAEHKHADGEKCDCAHGEFDPHVWLGIPEAKCMVRRVAELLGKQDPAHKADYEARAEAYNKKLDKLLADGLKALDGKKNRKFITNHHSFRYFARAFKLEVVDSIQMQPGVEADGTQMARLVKLCKENDVRVIGVEPQYSRKAAETLQSSLRKDLPELVIVELDPIETAPPERLGPDYYLERMRQNVENLAKHLR
jgi:ABC-type Zn uptake system ZnuABC Zn-binding protein ZnuA